MVNCSNCGFKVGNNMKFALMKNVCPSCGGMLFSRQEADSISHIQNLLLGQSFSSKISEQLAYDLALFFFNEMLNGSGKKIVQQLSKKEELSQTVQPKEEGEEDVLRRIREDVRNSVLADVDEENSELEEKDEDEDVSTAYSENFSEGSDPRVARLKRLAQNNPILKKGSGGFRRVTND